MKASEKERGNNNCGLIGVAAAFLFAAVPISMQVAAADGGRPQHLAAAHGKIEDCGVLKVQARQDDNFAERVAAVRKQLGTDSL